MSAPTASVPSTSTTLPTEKKSHFSGFQVPHILSWKNPYETGSLLAEALGIFLVLSSTFSLRFFLKIFSTVIGLFSVVEWGSRAISGQRKGLILNYRPSRFLPLSDSFVQDLTNYLTYSIRRVTHSIEGLVDAREPFHGLQLAGLLYATYVFLGLFSLKTLVLLSILFAFGLPPLYLQFKAQIDEIVSELLSKAHKQTKVLHDKIDEKAGPQISQVKKLFGSRGGFPGTATVNPIGEVPTAAAQPTAYTSSAAHPESTATSRATPATSANNAATPFASFGSADAVKSAATSHTPETTTVHAPETAAKAAGVAGAPIYEKTTTTTSPDANTTTTTKTTTTTVPADEFKNFSTVPTLVGNVPIDQEKLSAALSADKAKNEGAVNGL